MSDEWHAYERLNTDSDPKRPVAVWQRIHANGEQTRVVVLPWGDAYAAIAADIDPADFRPLAAEVVAVDPTADGAETRARRWCTANPKGVAPGGDGLLSRLVNWANTLDADGGNSTQSET